MMNEIEQYFLDRCDEILSLSERGDVWPFLCNASMIDYLTNMVTGGKSKRESYIKFVEDYFSEINKKYKDFEYRNGKKDLPGQMYCLLRCGLIHRFSLIPGEEEKKHHARVRSIILTHEVQGSFLHLTRCTRDGLDSVIFTAEQFSRDVKDVVRHVFIEAKTNQNLSNTIKDYIAEYPPVAYSFRLEI